MFFLRITLSVLAVAPFLGALAGSNTGVKLDSRQNGNSIVALISDTQSKMDELIPSGTQPINDPELALTTISKVFDYTNIVNAAMSTFSEGNENLLVDVDGKKLDDVQVGEKIVQLWQSFGKVASLVKDSGSGSVATIIKVTAINMGLFTEDLSHIAEGVAKLPTVIDAATTSQDLMTGIVESMLGPEFDLD